MRKGVAYKREERREQKKSKNRKKIKSIKRTEREQERKERKKGTQNRRCHRSLPKRRSKKKTEARAKEIARHS